VPLASEVRFFDMGLIERSGMSKIKVLENFIDSDDIKTAISLIDMLVDNNGKDSIVGYSEDPQSLIQHARHVFTDPQYPEVEALVKKYHSKVMQIDDAYANTYPHSVILVRYDIGGELELHNDFENYSPCDHCTHANAVYLNDDFVGGDIYFPEVGESFHPAAGTLIYFPQTSVTEDHSDMIHGVTPVTSGTKYLINFCVTTDPNRIMSLSKQT
jgi:hypothetical protein